MRSMPDHLERQLTELDFARLRKLAGGPEGQVLAALLANADVVPGPQIGPGVVTMYTQFELEDVETRQSQVLAICYPEDAEPAAGFISVLSPLGASLIGLRSGAVVACQAPSGSKAALIRSVLFQPEASGDYST